MTHSEITSKGMSLLAQCFTSLQGGPVLRITFNPNFDMSFELCNSKPSLTEHKHPADSMTFQVAEQEKDSFSACETIHS